MAHLLLTTDGSDLALDAMRRAFELVPHPDKVTLLAISEATPELMADGGGIEGPTMTPTEVEAMLTESNRHAEAALLGASVLVPGGVDVDRVLEHGDPGATICNVAERIGADVIVVGSHGKNWIKRVVLGSVSQYVVHHARCAVLVVPAPSDHHGDDHRTTKGDTPATASA